MMAPQASWRAVRTSVPPWGVALALAFWIGRDGWGAVHSSFVALAVAAVLGACFARRGPWPEAALVFAIACFWWAERSSPGASSGIAWSLGVSATLFAYYGTRFARRIRSGSEGSGLHAYTRRALATIFMVGLVVWMLVALVASLPGVAGSVISDRWASSVDAESPTVLALAGAVIVLVAAATTALRTSVSFNNPTHVAPKAPTPLDRDPQPGPVS